MNKPLLNLCDLGKMSVSYTAGTEFTVSSEGFEAEVKSFLIPPGKVSFTGSFIGEVPTALLSVRRPLSKGDHIEINGKGYILAEDGVFESDPSKEMYVSLSLLREDEPAQSPHPAAPATH